MSWLNKRVLVTGAGGFIGSHLTERLVREGADVRAFVRYTSNGSPGLLGLADPHVRRSLDVVFGDLRDPDAVDAAVGGREMVFHLGALIAIPYSYVHPTEVAAVNVIGTQNVLNAARRRQAHVIHTSTSEVYGTARYAPIDEAHPLQPQSPYSASKIGADALALSYHASFELPVSVVRPFNTYGPRQSGRAVIPTIVAQALHRDRIELGALAPTRDLLFVSDTVDGFLRSAAHPEALGTATNLGTGVEISIGELAERIAALVGRDVPIRSTEERVRPGVSEVFRLVCDPGRARDKLGWRPQVALDAGLRDVIAFMRDHPDWTDAAIYRV
ncbi:MAG: NAD-dependent epimerase/dehydratase family protein [Deinococcus-Thermus bacterium]|jgi:dTDP-glucose 4,6-dehydratase|nr:NAD-dependent epimerase/dehydratase family protein [Deinococcota bacterium]